MHKKLNTSHIIGGSSSSSSQKGFFRGFSFTSFFLSSTSAFSSTLSSTFCFSSPDFTLQTCAGPGLGAGTSDGEKRGSAVTVAEILGTIAPPLSSFSSFSSRLSLSTANVGLVGALEGRACDSAATATILLEQQPSDKANINRKYAYRGN